jgi:hypothetical protein
MKILKPISDDFQPTPKNEYTGQSKSMVLSAAGFRKEM